MKKFRVRLIEEVEGYAYVAAESSDQAETIASQTLWDDGVAAFPDFVQNSKDCHAYCEDRPFNEALVINEEALKQIKSQSAADNTHTE